MEEKMVEIARFASLEEGQVLVSLLKSQGVNCYLRNETATKVMGPLNMQGVSVELLEGDVPHAMEIMQENGYEIPAEDELPGEFTNITSWTRHIPFVRNLSFEKQIFVFIILIVVMLFVMVYGTSLLSLK